MSTKPAWLTPLARLVRLDLQAGSSAGPPRRILAFFAEHLQALQLAQVVADQVIRVAAVP